VFSRRSIQRRDGSEGGQGSGAVSLRSCVIDNEVDGRA
jgi:hypothetical protein